MKMVEGSTVRHGRADCSYRERVWESHSHTGEEEQMKKKGERKRGGTKTEMKEVRKKDSEKKRKNMEWCRF